MQVLTDLKSQVLVAANPFRDLAIPNYSYVMLDLHAVARTIFFRAQHLFRSFRTLMSIEKRVESIFKVRKDLNNQRRA